MQCNAFLQLPKHAICYFARMPPAINEFEGRLATYVFSCKYNTHDTSKGERQQNTPGHFFQELQFCRFHEI